MPRCCTLLPKVIGEWMPEGEASQPFKYYMAIDDSASPHTFTEAGPDPLLLLLAKNDPGHNSPFKIDSGSGLYPLRSSPQVAMVLGFHAWKRPGLKLVEIRYRGLIGNKAPYLRPMGSFWLIRQVDVAGMVAHSGLTLRYASFNLEVHTSGAVQSSEEMVEVAKGMQAKKRKSVLEFEIANLKAELEGKQSELKRLKSAADRQRLRFGFVF